MVHTFTAVILAAGNGGRMGLLGQQSPKGLMVLGENSLVEQSIRTLLDRGIRSIRIVTGHLCEQYEKMVENLRVDIELIYNPDHQTTDSLVSLNHGLAGLAGPCLILESDIVYEPRALEDIDPDRSRLIVSSPTGSGDEVYVWTTDQRGSEGLLARISKNATVCAYPSSGEYVGITALNRDATRKLQNILPSIARRLPTAEYEFGLETLAQTMELSATRINDLKWAEIDNEEMRLRTTKLIYPQIVIARRNLPATSTNTRCHDRHHDG